METAYSKHILRIFPVLKPLLNVFHSTCIISHRKSKDSQPHFINFADDDRAMPIARWSDVVLGHRHPFIAPSLWHHHTFFAHFSHMRCWLENGVRFEYSIGMLTYSKLYLDRSLWTFKKLILLVCCHSSKIFKTFKI